MKCAEPSSATFRIDLASWTRDDGETRLLKPADDHRPVPAQAVRIHRVDAFNRLAVVATNDLSPARRAKQGTANRVHAAGPNKESPVDLDVRNRFPLAIVYVIVEVVYQCLPSIVSKDRR